jgi:transposase
VVRTDRRRLTPLTRSTPATIALRSTVRARRDLVEHRVAATNQLRAHLQIVFPGVVGLFSDLDSQVSLAFLERFTTQGKADWLTPARLGAWLSKVGYSGRVAPEVLHQRLLAAPRGTTNTDAEAHAAVTLAFVAVLRGLTTQIAALAEAIAKQFEVHPDAHIAKSLPRAGTLRAARLLAEIGDARGRFPTAASLACLAGVAPSTRQSGKVKAVTFRWSADKELRDALCDFAGDCRRANPWAADLYDRARARGHDHPHAVRILGRAWANIIWRCWQDGVAYDPSRHNALQRVLNEHAARAA